MKKRTIFILSIVIFTMLSISCDVVGMPSIDLSALPESMSSGTLYLNYDSGIGSANISTTKIDIIRGPRQPLDASDQLYYDQALEFDTDTLTGNGYSITSTFTPGTTESDPIFTLICTKSGEPTIKFVFDIYYPNDIMVEKFVDNVQDTDYLTFLTWDDNSST